MEYTCTSFTISIYVKWVHSS